MIVVNFLDRKYSISFKHAEYGVRELVRRGFIQQPPKRTPSTRLTTEVLIAGNNSSGQDISYRGISVCSHVDKFSRARGRRLALKDCICQSRKWAALHRDDATLGHLGRVAKNPIGKEFARAIWFAYFTTCRDGQSISWKLDKTLDSVKKP